MRICVTLTEPTTTALVDRMIDLGSRADLLEIRADHVQDLDQVLVLRARVCPLVFTHLPACEGGLGDDEAPQSRRRSLLEAVKRGFDYVDVNLRSGLFDVMMEKSGHGLIVSYHDLEGVPGDDELERLYHSMRDAGADIAKIAGRPRTLADVGRLLAFARRVASQGDGPPFVPIAMGTLGVPSRLLGGRYGTPFTFASPADGDEAAPGQVPLDRMVSLYRARDVGPETQVFGVLGQGVGQSPLLTLHNVAFRARALDAVCIPLEADSLQSLLLALPGLALAGFAVTPSFQSPIVRYLAKADPTVAATGRADTVLLDSGRLCGSLAAPSARDDLNALLAQAMVQFETWTGLSAPADAMCAALERIKEEARA